MASSAINVPNPVATPTAVQLAQIADNIAFSLQNMAGKGQQYLDLYDAVYDLAAAIRMLAQAGLAVNNSTASSVGSVNVRGAYALGANAAIPTTINTAAV